MPHYGHYTQDYAGSLIPEADFPQAVARARDALDAMKRQYQIHGSDYQHRMALCAMAEAVYTARGVTAATMGSVSVRYGTGKTPEKALYQAACRYLDVYRGVEA